jgi:hypothetical protein
VLSDANPCDINVLNGWVYYSDFNDGFALYRIRTDGTDHQKLADGYCRNLYVAESGLYFDRRNENNRAQVYHANLDGSEPELLVPDMDVKYYYDGRIYCSTVSQFSVYDIASGTLTPICEEYVYNVSVDDTGIYYWSVDENAFRRRDLDGGNKSVVLQGGDFFNYSDGKLYYMGYGGDNYDYFCLYRLDTATGEASARLSLSGEFYADDGTPKGYTLVDLRENTELAESIPQNELGEREYGLTENFNYPYIIGGYEFTRGSLLASKLEKGSWDCLILLDGAHGKVWD